MTALSKTSPPSLFDSCIYIVFSVPMLKQNLRFLKQARFSRSLDIPTEMASQIHKDDNLLVYSPQKKSKVLILECVSYSNNFQKVNNRNESEFSSSIAAYVVLIIAIICNYLQKLHAERVHITVFGLLNNFLKALKTLNPMNLGPFFQRKPLEMKGFVKSLEHFSKSPELPLILGLLCGSLQIKTVFAKDLRHFRMSPEMISISGTFCSQKRMEMIAGDLKHNRMLSGKPAILDPFYIRIPFDMKLCPKDLEQFFKVPETLMSRTFLEKKLPSLESYRQHYDLGHIRKSTEKPKNLDPFFQDQIKLLTGYSEPIRKIIETKVSQNLMKDLKMCYSCEETISKKKFFDERRFGILNKCDCLICYGCLRKTAGTSGVVMGPVTCPSCSVMSDIVAANARWIEGKEKLKFFELLQEHGPTQMKLDMTDLSPILLNPLSFCASETDELKVHLSLTFESNIVTANASCIEGQEKIESFDLLQKQETPTTIVDRTQRHDMAPSLNTISFPTSKVAKLPLQNTVAANASGNDVKDKRESFDMLQKQTAPKKKLDQTVYLPRNDYFSTRIPIMGLVN